jgi:L-Ala-D/L-Glu epimerase
MNQINVWDQWVWRSNNLPLLDCVSRFQFGVKRCSLKQPYILSFGSLNYFDSIWIIIEDEKGRLGIGESVPLPGYAKETVDDVLSCLKKIKSKNLTLQEIKHYSHSIKNCFPFTASALMMALESLVWLEKVSEITPIPLAFPLASGAGPENFSFLVRQALDKGYRSFKMKIGIELAQDIHSSKELLSLFPQEKIKVSFDANQGYSLQEALRFCGAVEQFDILNRVYFVEQLLPVESLNEYRELCLNTSLTIMLDESIYTEKDICMAKEVGCGAIKLKLFKNFGMDNTFFLAQKAYDLGLEVILGNGVSTDIGNLYEALIISSKPEIFGPWAECNGYLKLREPMLFTQLQMENGKLVWIDQGGKNLLLRDQILKKNSL